MEIQTQQKPIFEEGKSYILKEVHLFMRAINLGDQCATYLGNYLSNAGRLIHTFGIKPTRESYEELRIWDRNLSGMEGNQIFTAPRAEWGHVIMNPERDELGEETRQTRLRGLHILGAVA